MSDYIDTRDPGWRRTAPGETVWPRAVARIEYFEGRREVAGWVREAPVPPLPTEVASVIKIGGWRFVLMDAIGGVFAWFLLCPPTVEAAESMNRANVRAGAGYGVEFVQAEAQQQGGFQVLAKPVPAIEHVFSGEELAEERDEVRRETAKAVLDRVHAVLHSAHGQVPARISGPEMDAIAREFGVEQ